MRAKRLISPAPFSVNGTQVYSTTAATLGTSVATIELGNETNKQPFQIIADNVSVMLQ